MYLCHLQVSTLLDHKRVDGRVELAKPPHLSEMLREIDGILYLPAEER